MCNYSMFKLRMHFAIEGFLMSHKNYALDLYKTKSKGIGPLRATKWHQELCNRVRGNEVIQENQHAF